MSVRNYRASMLGGSALLALLAVYSGARAQVQQSPQQEPAPAPPVPEQAAPASAPPGRPQVQLPELTVHGAIKKPARPVAQHTAPASAPSAAPVDQATVKNDRFDAARDNLYTTIGTTSDTISHATIEALPQGTNATVEKVLLQAPGVSQDSAASGLLHVRNDHANAQFRINGVMLPDGVTGFSSIFDTGFVGSLSLVTGALPAEYGMRTTGLIDITTRNDVFDNSGSVSYYGGSRGTIEPSFDYGGTAGNNCPAVKSGSAAAAGQNCWLGVQYYFSGRYLQ